MNEISAADAARLCVMGAMLQALVLGCTDPVSPDHRDASGHIAERASPEPSAERVAPKADPVSDAVFASTGSATVYLLRDGIKWPIADPATNIALSGGTADGWPDWSKATRRSRRELEIYPTAQEITLAAALEGRFVKGDAEPRYTTSEQESAGPCRIPRRIWPWEATMAGVFPTGAAWCTFRDRTSLAEQAQYQAVMLEAPEGRRLAEMLVPPLRQLLFRLSRTERARTVARRGLGVLRSFAAAFKLKVGDVEFTVEPEAGAADSGILETDLPEVLLATAAAAREAGSGIALFLDELQYLLRDDLAALIVSVHKLSQKGLPFVLFGAGLPQLAGLAGEAKSYAERLLDYPEVGALEVQAASEAIAAPVRREGAEITAEALASIVARTSGYPYFLQEWGSQAWNAAGSSPITAADVDVATARALEALDRGFFRVRLDRLTPREKDYVRAMAELGPGPHRSGEIAQKLGLDVTTAGSLRDKLLKKGMVYSPQHGDTAFTVPMFDQFMRRTMPEWTPAGPGEPRRVKRGRA